MDEFEYQLRAQKEEQEGRCSEETATKTWVDPNDGTVYEWDAERNGWFPKVAMPAPPIMEYFSITCTAIDR